MRIGLSALLLGGRPGVRKTGVSRYEAQLTAALLALDGAEEYRVYSLPGEDARFNDPSAVWRVPYWPAERPPLRIAWEQTGLVAQAYRDRIDLLHGMAFVTPPAWRGSAVVTIHDLDFMKGEGNAPARRKLYLSTMTRQSAKRADRVIAISTQTASDIQEIFGTDRAKISMIPLGVTPGMSPLSPEDRAAFRAANDLTRPTIFYLGTLEPRKNLPNLLRAFDLIAEETGAELVLGGAVGWLTTELNDALSRLRWRDRVRLTGFIPETDLAAWMSSADVFAFPSRYEGFGLPPLEAMACGTPVVASAASSLPEVLGDAALLEDPDDIDGIGGALARVLGEPALSNDLRTRGFTRAARYSWAETARLTREVYREVRREK
jgi:glycosyltransferase involved in cell wall biosynthesis